MEEILLFRKRKKRCINIKAQNKTIEKKKNLGVIITKISFIYFSEEHFFRHYRIKNIYRFTFYT